MSPQSPICVASSTSLPSPTQGFTRAAEALHVSQQALSSSIHQLEKNLGATLFERAGRKVALTRAGHALLGEGRALLAAARTMGEHVRRVASDSAEEFVVGHTPALSGVEVYTLLERAIDASPAVSFTLRQLYPGDLTAAVLSGEIHLGLRRGVAPPHELAAAIIGYHPVRVAVPGGTGWQVAVVSTSKNSPVRRWHCGRHRVRPTTATCLSGHVGVPDSNPTT